VGLRKEIRGIFETYRHSFSRDGLNTQEYGTKLFLEFVVVPTGVIGIPIIVYYVVRIFIEAIRLN